MLFPIEFSAITKWSQDRRGFTIPELIIGVSLVALLTLMSVGMVIAAHQLMPGRSVAINGVDVPIAPSPEAFADAVRFHRVFTERLHSGRAVYVLGGTHQSLPPTASRCSGAPLKIQALPVIDKFDAGLPEDAYGFYQSYQSILGGMETTPSSSADFSILIIGILDQKLQVTALVQVRSHSVALNDGAAAGSFLERTAQLYDVSGDTLSYSFLERESIAAQSAVGARHFWYRYEENRVAEEGPAVAVFPDPWIFAGSVGRTPLSALSRFVYCLPISR